ncbi:MAG: TIGR02147 family protein [Fibrobacter sp.]|nr:TIGR02147 family protein [Fibrobacter sp.]
MESIYKYKDYRAYIKDYYENAVAQNMRFSLRSFASKLGLNVSNLTRILKGERNISETTAKRFTCIFKLHDRESQYFLLLVHYNQARTQEDKQLFYEQIRLFRKTRLRNLGPEYDEYFSQWYNVALRELINILPAKLNSTEIAKLLQPSPKPNDIRKSLNLLIRLGLIKKHEDGTLALSEKFVSTPDEWTSTTIHSFQIGMAELGKEALNRFPKNERNISTFTLSLSSQGFGRVAEAVRRFQQEIADIANSDQNPDRVYELNCQFFPLSKPCREHS